MDGLGPECPLRLCEHSLINGCLQMQPASNLKSRKRDQFNEPLRYIPS